MGDREFKFDEEVICDVCGKEGAFDIYGDFICSDCLIEAEKIAGEEKDGEEN